MEQSQEVRQRRLEVARRAVRDFYAQCFWSYRENAEITEADIPWIIRELRHYVMFLHEQHIHLGALAWADAGKDPGMNAEWIIDWGGRQARLNGQAASQLQLQHPPDLHHLPRQWTQTAEEALVLIEKLSVIERGCFYLDSMNKPVCPDPVLPSFQKLARHYGSVKGAWPRIDELS